MKDRKILILGIGNVLMGDEGVGVHAVQQLDDIQLPPNVDILDGGTGGFHLLSYLQDYPEVILIDATMDGEPLGTVAVRQPRFSNEFPRALTAHDIGLKDLIDAVSFTGKMPKVHLITVTIDNLDMVGVMLSDKVKAAIPEVKEKILEILSATTHPANI